MFTRSCRKRRAALVVMVNVLFGACRGDANVDVVQIGYRGTALTQQWNHADLQARFDSTSRAMPEALPPAEPMPPGPLPWQNVQVLTDVSVTELLRTMTGFATWVGGDPANCQYCHWVDQPWSDTSADGRPLYRKLVARRMIQMVREINGKNQAHVKNTGVTCYTCHLGKPLPNGLWVYSDQTDYLRHYLDRDGARVVTQQIAPSPGNRSSVKQAEWTYALMIDLSRSIGVNCTYCHNTRQFASWRDAPPARVTAYHGILMVRDINTNFLAELQTTVPLSRLGPLGDAPKIQCLSCHNGTYKPLFGAQLAKLYPALWGRPQWNGIPFPGASASADSAAAMPTLSAAPTPP